MPASSYAFGNFIPLPSSMSQNSILMNARARVRGGASRQVRTRQPIIENPKDLAAEFACAVTVYSENQSDWVARNGNESIYRTLRRILPEVRFISISLFPKSLQSQSNGSLRLQRNDSYNLTFHLFGRLGNQMTDAIV
jgi:hypothetical protein